ncbi:MAG: DUF2071 domain-containing protein [Anaerolineales bacterium]|nr:DUF2071 domain-containing protein [Anaerolineales bacterium]
MIGDIARLTEHRPWPLPSGPWVMAQQWQDLLFAHWPLPPAAVQALIPPALPIDTFDGQAWLAVVPFRMRNVRPRLLPAVPWLSHFHELNVRTYVRVRDQGVEKRGVYFFSLDAANPMAVWIARHTFHLPYFNAAMQSQSDENVITYSSHRRHRGAPRANFSAIYGPAGQTYQARPGDLDHWLTERYALYTVDHKGCPMIGEIHHAPWPLQPGKVDGLQAADLVGAAAIALPNALPLLHFARTLDVLVWPLRTISPNLNL